MKKYQVWIEGFLATGEHARASLIGEVEANSFQEACDALCGKYTVHNENYNRENRTVWGCRLFDNEADARKSFR